MYHLHRKPQLSVNLRGLIPVAGVVRSWCVLCTVCMVLSLGVGNLPLLMDPDLSTTDDDSISNECNLEKICEMSKWKTVMTWAETFLHVRVIFVISRLDLY